MELNFDPETFQLFRTGDPHAFRGISAVLRRPVYIICFRRLKERSLATTATNYVLEKIKKHARTFNNESHLKGYLVKTIVSTCIDVWRQQQRENKSGRNLVLTGDEQLFNELTTNEWQSAMLQEDALDALMHRVLDPEQRTLLNMYYKENYKMHEISAHLQMPISTVSRKLKAAVAELRTYKEKIDEKRSKK